VSITNVPITATLSPADLDRLVAAKNGRTVSVVIPAQNESPTIGAVVDAVSSTNRRWPGLIDEIIVIDDHSTDDTAAIAQRHGARVAALRGPGGKGQAMQFGLSVASGDIVAFLDADVINTTDEFAARLVAPLLLDSNVNLVKAFYERPLHNMPTGGGRVTELAARPILSLLFPGLGEIRQPLAGETAGRRDVFAKVGFEDAYGVEIALLIDVASAFGVSTIAQVDLGVRRHRNRPIEELRPMSVDVLRAALTRFGVRLPS
jgi:glucosyl-3-phosphoglycerate synthase